MAARKKILAKVNIYYEGGLIRTDEEIKPGTLPQDIIDALVETGGAKRVGS